MAGYAPLTRPTKTKTPVGRVKTRQRRCDRNETLVEDSILAPNAAYNF